MTRIVYVDTLLEYIKYLFEIYSLIKTMSALKYMFPSLNMDQNKQRNGGKQTLIENMDLVGKHPPILD